MISVHADSESNCEVEILKLFYLVTCDFLRLSCINSKMTITVVRCSQGHQQNKLSAPFPGVKS